MEHGGGRRRPDLGGRRARGRTEEPPGTDLPPRASGFVARRQGSESPASRGCPWRACPLDLERATGVAAARLKGAPRRDEAERVSRRLTSAVAAGGERWCVGVGGGVP